MEDKKISEPLRHAIQKGGKFEPEKDRYHLYVAYGCPWATRTLIARQLKGLESIIGVTVVSPRMGPNGWQFGDIDSFPGAEPDPLYGAKYIKDLYLRADPDYAGPFTVPVLWDKRLGIIVNNESSDIIRIFNTAFNGLLPEDKASLDLYPDDLRVEIEALNAWIYDTINNGVYTAGCATSQKAYETAVFALFGSLDRLEKILEGKDYLVGNRLTEADIRLFATIIRFDVAYHGAFKCNIRDIRNGYPAIHLWLRKLYWNIPAFKDTCKFDHIKVGYYTDSQVNPSLVTPVGPIPDILPL